MLKDPPPATLFTISPKGVGSFKIVGPGQLIRLLPPLSVREGYILICLLPPLSVREGYILTRLLPPLSVREGYILTLSQYVPLDLNIINSIYPFHQTSS